MLSDFELQRLRAEKKRQKQAKTPAVEIAMRLAKKNKSPQQLREELAPFIEEKVDPLREALKEWL